MVETRGRPAKTVKAMIERYQREPALWLRDTFGTHLWEKQEEILMSVWENRRTAVKSCYGSGKSFVAGAVATAFLHLRPNSLVITTAPSHRQLQNIWTPIYQMLERQKAPLGTRVLQHKMICGPGWEAMGFTTDMPERIQGFHAEWVLIIVDESAGMDPAIHDRLNALMVGDNCYRLDIGNPHEPQGPFFDLFSREDVNKFTISAFDTPNVRANEELIPGLITNIWIEERRREYGEGTPMWQVEVLGEFPPSGEEQLIPVQWVKLAEERWHEEAPQSANPIHGLDPGGGGLAETVLCTRSGRYVHPLCAWTGITGPEIISKASDRVGKRDMLFVDNIGVGYHLVEFARQSKLYAEGVNVQSSPRIQEDRYLNLRAELYWKLRQSLDPDGEIKMCLPPDKKLHAQLTGIKYKHNNKGKIQVESKDDMKKRSLPSPDRADALALTMMFDDGYYMMPSDISGETLSSAYEDAALLKESHYVEWNSYYH